MAEQQKITQFDKLKRIGRACEFVTCDANKRDNPDRTFFKFPVKNKNRCKQWVLNCKNERITDLNFLQLQNRAICNQHFARSCFTSDMLNKLEKNAVPTPPDTLTWDGDARLPAHPVAMVVNQSQPQSQICPPAPTTDTDLQPNALTSSSRDISHHQVPLTSQSPLN